MLYVMPLYVPDCDDTLSDEAWRKCMSDRVRAICAKLKVAGETSPHYQAMMDRLDEIAARRGQDEREALKAALVVRRLRGDI